MSSDQTSSDQTSSRQVSSDPLGGGRSGGDTVHNRISALRAERGVTRRQLADAVEVHYQTIGYLERGEFNPGLHLAIRIAEFFQLPVEVVFSLRPFPRIGDDSQQIA